MSLEFQSPTVTLMTGLVLDESKVSDVDSITFQTVSMLW